MNVRAVSERAREMLLVVAGEEQGCVELRIEKYSLEYDSKRTG